MSKWTKTIGMGRNAAIGVSLLLAACASPQTGAVSTASPGSVTFDPTRATGSRLGPQNLNPGECGLFLWGQGAGRPLQFFQNARTQEVSVPFKRGSKITRISAENAAMDGLFTRQRFMVDDIEMDVSFTLAEGRNVLQGVAVSGGRIELTEPSGRETVIPIVGLYGCSN